MFLRLGLCEEYNDGTNSQYQRTAAIKCTTIADTNSLYSDLHIQVDGPDYYTDLPIIEDPSRAVILLRNLAIAHAVSQGRDAIGLEDVSIVIKVALSTAITTE